MTNYEKIKAADIDELANLLQFVQFGCEFCVCYPESGPCSMPCDKGVKKWLESEAEDNGTV